MFTHSPLSPFHHFLCLWLLVRLSINPSFGRFRRLSQSCKYIIWKNMKFWQLCKNRDGLFNTVTFTLLRKSDLFAKVYYSRMTILYKQISGEVLRAESGSTSRSDPPSDDGSPAGVFGWIDACAQPDDGRRSSGRLTFWRVSWSLVPARCRGMVCRWDAIQRCTRQHAPAKAGPPAGPYVHFFHPIVVNGKDQWSFWNSIEFCQPFITIQTNYPVIIALVYRRRIALFFFSKTVHMSLLKWY